MDVTFDVSSFPSNGQSLTYEWDFGDGNQATTNNPSTNHSYLNLGTFPVIVKIKNGSTILKEINLDYKLRELGSFEASDNVINNFEGIIFKFPSDIVTSSEYVAILDGSNIVMNRATRYSLGASQFQVSPGMHYLSFVIGNKEYVHNFQLEIAEPIVSPDLVVADSIAKARLVIANAPSNVPVEIINKATEAFDSLETQYATMTADQKQLVAQGFKYKIQNFDIGLNSFDSINSNSEKKWGEWFLAMLRVGIGSTLIVYGSQDIAAGASVVIALPSVGLPKMAFGAAELALGIAAIAIQIAKAEEALRDLRVLESYSGAIIGLNPNSVQNGNRYTNISFWGTYRPLDGSDAQNTNPPPYIGQLLKDLKAQKGLVDDMGLGMTAPVLDAYTPAGPTEYKQLDPNSITVVNTVNTSTISVIPPFTNATADYNELEFSCTNSQFPTFRWYINYTHPSSYLKAWAWDAVCSF